MNPDMPIQHRHHLEADRTFGFTQIELRRGEVSRLKQLHFTLTFMNQNEMKTRLKVNLVHDREYARLLVCKISCMQDC